MISIRHYLNSCKLGIKTIKNTKILQGNKIYFILGYFLVKTEAFLDKRSTFLNNGIKYILYKFFTRRLMIKNEVGIFEVTIKNDSFKKSLPYFEYNTQKWLNTLQD